MTEVSGAEQAFREFFVIASQKRAINNSFCPFCNKKRMRNKTKCFVKLVCPKCGIEIMYKPMEGV